MTESQYEKLINEGIYNILREFLDNNNQISKEEKDTILKPLYDISHTEGTVTDYFKELALQLKQTLNSLTLEVVEDTKRKKVKEYEFIKLAIYLLSNIKDYLLKYHNTNPNKIYDSILNDYLNKLKTIETIVPGATSAIKDGKLNHTLTTYAGQISSDQDSPQIDENTRFDIASITKMFTALEALKLNEEGLYNIQNPVSSYGPYNLDMSVEDLAKFTYKIQTDGRIDEDISLAEVKRRLYSSKVIEKSHFYSDIPYIILGDIIPHRTHYYKELFIQNLGLSQTNHDRTFGNLTGGAYNNLEIVHDPKGRILEKYGINPGHAGIYSTSQDLIKLFDGLTKGFLNEKSLNILTTKNYKNAIVYDKKGKPIIEQIGNRTKYRNINRAMGVYISHPYGIRHTEVPDIASTTAFSAAGFTGSYTLYDLQNKISANILVNPFSSQTKVKIPSDKMNDLKVMQIHYVCALRLVDYVLKKQTNVAENNYSAFQKKIQKPTIIKRGE